jgi:hypothetical protein
MSQSSMLITFSIWQGLIIGNRLNFGKMKNILGDILFHNNNGHTRLNSKVYCHRQNISGAYHKYWLLVLKLGFIIGKDTFG